MSKRWIKIWRPKVKYLQLTYFEKLSRRSQSFTQIYFSQKSVDFPSTIQLPEA